MAKARRADKPRIIAAIKEILERELEVVAASAKAAHEAATHEDAKPENEYDTRGLEASYLARGQAARAAELQEAIATLHHLEPAAFGAEDPIAATALVELESDDTRQYCLLLPYGAGTKVELDKRTITVVTPASPLGQALLGRTEGDSFEMTARGALREYEIVRVE